MAYFDLSGLWHCSIPGMEGSIIIPGTLDEAGIGFPDKPAASIHPDSQANDQLSGLEVIATRFTRKVTFEGEATLTRTSTFLPDVDQRVFLEVERARCLRLLVNGQEVPHYRPATIVTPHVFEVTGLLTGQDTITLLSDNSYPGLAHNDIALSSAATDETQTNWNGLLGYVRLRTEAPAFVDSLRVYPQGDSLRVEVDIDAPDGWEAEGLFTSAALAAPCSCSLHAGANRFDALPLCPDVHRWDEEDGFCYTMTLTSSLLAEKTVSFGVRDFGSREGRLTLNDRPIFLCSEANCAVFPETGYPPMSVEAWLDILQTYRSYGVNAMRFHSHVPPEAAFTAADQLGILMQPECSHWNPRNALEADESFQYYATELPETLRMLANHPSFVMMTLGNELCTGTLGHARMDTLLRQAHAQDNTRLYANASNAHYGGQGADAVSDFYTGAAYYGQIMRATSCNMEGHINQAYPSADKDYSAVLASIRQVYAKPVFSFEVGQFEVLPDFAECDTFHGVTLPNNLRYIQQQVQQKGLAATWQQQVEATGELSNLCYREEIEAALRTEGWSGISLLGLQDFPGQGTALVGMLNSHMQPKPYPFAQPERFRSFFSGKRLLALLPRYTFEEVEVLTFPVKLANYGRQMIEGACRYTLSGASHSVTGTLPCQQAPCGGLTVLGTISLPLTGFSTPEKLTLTLEMDNLHSIYPLWVYSAEAPVVPENLYVTEVLDAQTEAVLRSGGKVYLTPPSEESHLPSSVQAQFSTDFWSVGTFPSQSGTMGLLIDTAHPLFASFPTESHTNWQWWPMASQRTFLLPEGIKPIITTMDCYAYLRSMGPLFEAKVGAGKLLCSSFGLQQLQQYPEARALLRSIYAYMTSNAFQPQQEVSLETLHTLVQ